MQPRNRPTWEEYALIMAHAAATRSQDPYVQVGACALRHDKTVAAVGYNGPPSGIEVDWSDRDQRLARMIHAEANCLRYCRPGEIELLACTLSPCVGCIRFIAGYRINTVVYSSVYGREDGAHGIAAEFGIRLVQLDVSKWITVPAAQESRPRSSAAFPPRSMRVGLLLEPRLPPKPPGFLRSWLSRLQRNP